MKVQKNLTERNFFKKILIKISRIFGYELIDQGNFSIPTQNKFLNENLNIQGKKSINLPLGEIKVSRKIKELTIIFRSCTKVNMLTQNKKRIFDKNKSEYTFRSLNSIIASLKQAQITFPQTKFNFIIIDHESNNEDIKQMDKQLIKSGFKYSIINLNTGKFKNNIKKINAKNENVTENQMSNMSNIHQSLIEAKENCNDLIYFVEDDYLHKTESFQEMLFTYERISSQLKRELILCPVDYPYLYSQIENTQIFLGSNKHWRKIDQTLCTFLTSNILIKKYWKKLISMCEFEHYPFEKPLHDIYKVEYCFSPIPSLAFHCTNVNSIFGISPNFDWKSTWDKNENY